MSCCCSSVVKMSGRTEASQSTFLSAANCFSTANSFSFTSGSFLKISSTWNRNDSYLSPLLFYKFKKHKLCPINSPSYWTPQPCVCGPDACRLCLYWSTLDFRCCVSGDCPYTAPQDAVCGPERPLSKRLPSHGASLGSHSPPWHNLQLWDHYDPLGSRGSNHPPAGGSLPR